VPPPERVRPLPFDNLRGPDAFRLHNANVYPKWRDRAYLGYIDGGAFILDISDKSNPTVVGSWSPHPPYPGFTHTVMPPLSRDLLVVTDECVEDDAADWPKLTWMVDARKEDNLVPISTFPLPPVSMPTCCRSLSTRRCRMRKARFSAPIGPASLPRGYPRAADQPTGDLRLRVALAGRL